MNSSSDLSTIVALQHIQLFMYLDVVAIALLVYDYFLTIELEITHIWNSRISIPHVMFYFTRYLPFIESGLLLYRTFSIGVSIPTCTTLYSISAYLILAGIIVAELILSLRTWTVWRRNKYIGIGLIAFSLAAAVPAIPVMVMFSGSTQFMDAPYPSFRGCFLKTGSRVLSSVEWIILMVYDAGLLALMAIQAFRSLPVNNESIFKTFFSSSRPGELLKPILKDGILYYLFLFILSTLNVVVIRAMPLDFINLLTMFERVIHAILTCRVVLHIKDSARTDTCDDTTDAGIIFSANTIQFESGQTSTFLE